MAIDPYANCNPDPGVFCTLETCCLAQSNFLYLPDLGGNVFLAVFFGILIFPQLWLAIKYRTIGYAIGMIIGLILEVAGYAGRVVLHYNPFDSNGFLVYLICITIGPVFMSASIYLSIARIIRIYGEQHSFLKPKTLAILFMTSDFCSLVLQASGGAIADTSTGDTKQTGINVMIAGLLLQAISLAVFLTYLAIYALRTRRGVLDMTPAKVAVRNSSFFKVFLVTLTVAAIAILARSIFRVAELWEGFAGNLWNDEVDFMILDGGMIGLAALLLTVIHPGPAFGSTWNMHKKGAEYDEDTEMGRRRHHRRRRNSGHRASGSGSSGSRKGSRSRRHSHSRRAV